MGNETSCRLTVAWNARMDTEFSVRFGFANDLCLLSFQDMDLRFPPCDCRTPIRVVYPGAVIDRPYMKSRFEVRLLCELKDRLRLEYRLGLFQRDLPGLVL